jgi:hypothetical protein
MKNFGTITGILLMLILAGNTSLNAQRGMKGMRMDTIQMPGMGMRHDSTMIGGMRPGRNMNDMDLGMCPCQMHGRAGYGTRNMAHGPMMKGNWHQDQGIWQPGMEFNGPDFGYPPPGMWRQHDGMRSWTPGLRILDQIPNLSEKQKKDITDLLQKQQEEMKKFREDMLVKIKSMRNSHMEKIRSLLNDDQKKWLEERTGTAPEK